MRKFSRITLQIIGGANVASALLMLLVGHADMVQPADFPRLSNLGLLFPLFLVINLCFLFFWIFVKPRGIIIPLLGFIICYGPVRRYTPFNIPQEVPKGCLKVLSYNVWSFGEATVKERPNAILEYIKRQDADIVCLQESSEALVGSAQVDSILNPVYKYKDTAMHKGDLMTIFSKYPIIAKEHIDFESKFNMSCAFTLNVKGKPVIVVNNHLETTDLSVDRKEQFRELMKGDMDRQEATQTSKWLVNHLGEQTKKRAPQAEAVARYIAFHTGMPIIVCGDFNDSPLSYCHRVISQGLTDCYVSTGNGPGISYHKARIFVRIDNILCSDDFMPFACKVDNSIKNSDHYPIRCYLLFDAKK